MNPENDKPASTDATPPKKKRSLLRRVLIWLTVTFSVIVLLVAALIGGTVWMLTPDQLTPLLEKYSKEYLDAHVTAEKVELTLWNTFPRVHVSARNLCVVSKSLRKLDPEQRAQLPANADTLLTIDRLEGGINLWGVLSGAIRLYDVDITHLCLNMVKYDDKIANYDIWKVSDKDTSSTSLPAISINRFELHDGAPITYFSAQDSIDITINLRTTKITGNESPLYAMDITGGSSGYITDHFTLPKIPFGINGQIVWEEQHPGTITLKDFELFVAGVSADINLTMTFAEHLALEEFDMKMNSVRFDDVLPFIPEPTRSEIGNVKTDLTMNLRVQLLEAYKPTEVDIPTIKVFLTVPEGSLEYDNINLSSVKADIEATIKGRDIDQSTLALKNLTIGGRSMNFSLSGSATRLITDPEFDLDFNGRVNFSTIPYRARLKLPAIPDGIIRGSAHARMRLSELTPQRFHRIRARGRLDLDNFSVRTPDSLFLAYTRHTDVTLGTNTSLRFDSLTVDSLLSFRIVADTIAFRAEDMHVNVQDLSAAVAAKNTATSGDTAQINPFGMKIHAGRIAMFSDADSTRLRLQNSDIRASLRRYNNQLRTPLLNLDISTERLRYNNPLHHLSMTDGNVKLTLHPKGRSQQGRRMKSRIDSLLLLHPDISPDSALKMVMASLPRRERVAMEKDSSGRENIDFELDQGMRTWLRRWKAEGSLTARRGRLLTPYFPVRTVIQNLDMDFSTDSVTFTDTRCRLGRSDFLVNGTVSNISRALTSRRRASLKMDFDLQSDTIDVNQITQTIMAGSAFAQRHSKADLHLGQSDNDDSIATTLTQKVATDARAAFVVPSNLDADLRVRARQLQYADIWFQRFTGVVGVHDGAINLRRLAGYTPLGSMDLTALYSAPTSKDLNFAAGMVVRRLNLSQFLALLPELDSVLPLLKEVRGIVTADMAMSTELDSEMNLKFHTLNLVMRLEGDSLALVDSHAFRTAAKWLMLKDKNRITVNHMQVELMIRDSKLDLFPFMFDFDRYRLGVSGTTDMDMNYDYHIAVLRSPIPFKFGITVKGKPGHMRFGLGRARFNENAVASTHQLTDTARINLIHEIEKVFSFGVRNSKAPTMSANTPVFNKAEFSVADTLTHADSVLFIQGGAIPGPLEPPFPMTKEPKKDKKEKKKRH